MPSEPSHQSSVHFFKSVFYLFHIHLRVCVSHCEGVRVTVLTLRTQWNSRLSVLTFQLLDPREHLTSHPPQLIFLKTNSFRISLDTVSESYRESASATECLCYSIKAEKPPVDGCWFSLSTLSTEVEPCVLGRKECILIVGKLCTSASLSPRASRSFCFSSPPWFYGSPARYSVSHHLAEFAVLSPG